MAIYDGVVMLEALGVIGLRMLWQIWPGLLTCSVFWGACLTSDAIKLPTLTGALLISKILTTSGAGLNAVVTLANRGYMPVIGGSRFSLWVAASPGEHRLLWLADRFWGFSVGDFAIVLGMFSPLITSHIM